MRQLLGEIQKLANRAVLATEEGTRTMTGALQTTGQAGETIRTLSESISRFTQSAAYIADASTQQAQAISQIGQGLKNINDASTQALTATKQTEESAVSLERMGAGLRTLLERSSRDE